jgi:hypothetical protein
MHLTEKFGSKYWAMKKVKPQAPPKSKMLILLPIGSPLLLANSKMPSIERRIVEEE